MLERMTPQDIANTIHAARSRVLYAGPGLHREIASALCNVARDIGQAQIDLYLDVSEQALRLGYGTIDDIEMVYEEGITVNEARGIRIGVLLMDDDGWAFNLPAMMVENVNIPSEWPNAFRLTRDQVSEIETSFGEGADSHKAVSDDVRTGAGIFIQTNPVSKKAVDRLVHKLEESPPEPFDLSRKLKVYQRWFQFVELEFKGGSMSRHRLPLPTQLKNLLANEKGVQDRLKASYKFIESGAIESEGKLRQDVDALRREYLCSIPGIGSVLLVTQKRAFEMKLESIRREVEARKAEIQRVVEQQIDEARQQLETELVPIVVRRPPKELTSRLLSDVDQSVARQYVRDSLDRGVKKVRRSVGGMELKCIYKDVTIEMINSREFQEKIAEAFPYERWDSLVDEWNAISSQDS